MKNFREVKGGGDFAAALKMREEEDLFFTWVKGAFLMISGLLTMNTGGEHRCGWFVAIYLLNDSRRDPRISRAVSGRFSIKRVVPVVVTL